MNLDRKNITYFRKYLVLFYDKKNLFFDDGLVRSSLVREQLCNNPSI